MPHVVVHPLWGNLAPARHAGESLQDQMVQFFRSAIADGRVRGGQRVPSSRQLASECSVSRTTAVEVYQRLVAEGYLVARQGSGVFVADPPPERYALAAQGPAQPPAPRPDLSRIDMRNYLLPLAPGMPAIDRFPWSTWARLTGQICRERPLNAVGYGDPQGELVLRQAIAGYLATARGILCDPDQIIVSAGSEATLQYLIGQVMQPGEQVWVEDPCGPYMRQVSLRAGVVPVPIEVDQQGLDVAQALRRAPGARLAIVSPTHQYPTGATLSLARRRELVEWSEATGAWILESEIDGDYRYAPQPIKPVFALSGAHRVFYCGSLSKPLAPGLRVNYLVVPRQLMRSLSISTTLVPMLTQLVLARFSIAGHLASHLRRMRALYSRRRAVLLEALRDLAADCVMVPHVPEGGLRVAATLTNGIDDLRATSRLLSAGIKVDPLSTCFAKPGRSGLIIGFASTAEEQIPRAVATMAAVLRRELDS